MDVEIKSTQTTPNNLWTAKEGREKGRECLLQRKAKSSAMRKGTCSSRSLDESKEASKWREEHVQFVYHPGGK